LEPKGNKLLKSIKKLLGMFFKLDVWFFDKHEYQISEKEWRLRRELDELERIIK
jgi:hypothetical protein